MFWRIRGLSCIHMSIHCRSSQPKAYIHNKHSHNVYFEDSPPLDFYLLFAPPQWSRLVSYRMASPALIVPSTCDCELPSSSSMNFFPRNRKTRCHSGVLVCGNNTEVWHRITQQNTIVNGRNVCTKNTIVELFPFTCGAHIFVDVLQSHKH